MSVIVDNGWFSYRCTCERPRHRDVCLLVQYHYADGWRRHGARWLDGDCAQAVVLSASLRIPEVKTRLEAPRIRHSPSDHFSLEGEVLCTRSARRNYRPK